MNVGILGHVDAGKTTLARALSTLGSTAAFDKGAKTSNLRANTIDLGFSAVQLDDARRIALIDCPGHAQLISSVLIAASVFDGAIVVINAVKGIEPQTAEHLILASILCPEHVIIVFSKIDLVDDSRISTMKKKLPKLLKSLNIREDSPVVSLNLASDSDHLSELVTVLKSVYHVPKRQSSNKLVMAVDHCFPIKGKGTIMTGTVIDGTCKVGVEIEIAHLGERRKIKELQSWKNTVSEVSMGERAAILVSNLPQTDTIDRTVVFEPGALRSAKVLLVKLTKVEQFKGQLKNRTKIHLTIGFETTMAECWFLKMDGDEFEQLDDCSDDTTHVLMDLSKKVYSKRDQICLAARLDSQKLTECRFAFYGPVLEMGNSFDDLKIKRFHRKQKLGVVDRFYKDDSVICSGLFKKETAMEIFYGMQVVVDGFVGTIDESFGKSGKCKITLKSGIEDVKKKIEAGVRVEVVLKLKKFIDSEAKLMSYL
uniref:Tr-type G domain-containing protein n=1 Tax=Panagrolaimus sp. JU765 TaxID=591449 RepID=A0AC34QQD2_9BILA